MSVTFNSLFESFSFKFGLLLEAEPAILQEISDKADAVRERNRHAIVTNNSKLKERCVQDLIVLRDFLKSELEAPTKHRPYQRNVSDKEIDEYIMKSTQYPGLRHLTTAMHDPKKRL